jgi:hypothetical protein
MEMCDWVRSQKVNLRDGEETAFDIGAIHFLRPDPAGTSSKGEFAEVHITTSCLRVNSPFAPSSGRLGEKSHTLLGEDP